MRFFSRLHFVFACIILLYWMPVYSSALVIHDELVPIFLVFDNKNILLLKLFWTRWTIITKVHITNPPRCWRSNFCFRGWKKLFYRYPFITGIIKLCTQLFPRTLAVCCLCMYIVYVRLWRFFCILQRTRRDWLFCSFFSDRQPISVCYII